MQVLLPSAAMLKQEEKIGNSSDTEWQIKAKEMAPAPF